MSTYKKFVPIEEQADVMTTLNRVLDVVKNQNEPCNQLVDYRTEQLGTKDAKIVLIFDDDVCVKST